MPPDSNTATGKRLDYYRSLESMEGLIEAERSPIVHRVARFPGGRLLYSIYPGILAAGVIALASTWLSQHYGAPVMLFALLLGMAFHFLHESGRCVAGIEFSSRMILRTGVALLGCRITIEQIVELGRGPVILVMVGVITTILLGYAVARRLGLRPQFGVLSGGAVAICGASAALAIAAVLPGGEKRERDTILTVVLVTALSTLAMILYPILVTSLRLDHVSAGVFLGGTIHDVAQVVGAGYMVSPQTGDIATYVKLLRVAMLVPVVLVISMFLGQSKTEGQPARYRVPKVPLFLVGFVGCVALNSVGALPSPVVSVASEFSRWCLVTAIAALGMKTSFGELAAAGWRPLGLMVAETVWIGLLVLVAVEFVV